MFWGNEEKLCEVEDGDSFEDPSDGWKLEELYLVTRTSESFENFEKAKKGNAEMR